jgi:hypothetical protein
MREILLYITFFSGVLPILFYIFSIYQNGTNQTLKPAVPFLCLTVIGSLYEPIVTIVLERDSMQWFRIYNIAEFVCLYYFFWKLLYKKYRAVRSGFVLLFMTGSFLAVGANMGQLQLESIYAPFIFIFVLTFSTLWFRDTSHTEQENVKFEISTVLFICGFLLYYSGTLFFYLLSEVVLLKSKSMSYQDYWVVNIIATLILKIILTAGVWTGRKT